MSKPTSEIVFMAAFETARNALAIVGVIAIAILLKSLF